MQVPEIQFASSGEVQLAYQRYGAGPDVVVIPPLVSNIELAWEQELYRRVLEYHAQHVRVLEFDKRGIGSSDRFERHPTLDERIGDICAVMDTEGVERASLVGLSEGGLMAQLFAAMHPERVERVVLFNSHPGAAAYGQLRPYRRPDDPPFSTTESLGRLWQIVETWGRQPELFVDLFAPSQNGNAAFTRWMARYQRQTASPADFRRQVESIMYLDAADRLASIAAPTLVMHVTGDRLFPPSTARYLADRIPGARLAEFPGDDHFGWIMPGWRALSDCLLEFVTGAIPASRSERRFATVLFTDIVGSTAATARVGDEAWRRTLESHDRIAWKAVDRQRGTLVKNTGDGLLVTFDSPSQALACAAELVRELAGIGIAIRAGVHAGEIEVRDNGDVAGVAVNLAARVQQAAREGTIYVSSTVRDLLLGGERSFAERGEHELKGIAGTWRLYELTS